MSLSKIPVEVVEGSIFKYLSWNDLLRLRRVSTEYRTLVLSYIDTEKGTERAPEISVGVSSTEDYPDLKTFAELNIPTTKIYFRNLNTYLWFKEEPSHSQVEEIRAFEEKYGGKVKHLRLQKLSMYLEDADTSQLLKGLPNLESLSVDELLVVRPTPEQRPILPEIVFQNLNLNQNLKALDLYVNDYWWSSDQNLHTGAHKCLTIWLTECRSLQKLRLSMKWHTPPLIVRRLLEALILAVETGNGWESIELYLEPGLIDNDTVDVYQRLLATCAARNVAVAGVHAHWLEDRRPPQQRGSLISSSITDLRVGQRASDLRHLKLDKLTTLEITSVRAFIRSQGQEKPYWSATLKSLILDIRSSQVDVEMLFRGEQLIALRQVSLIFGNVVFEEQSSECLEQLIQIAPNLKELTLENWNGAPEAFARLLPRILGLEKLSLVDCRRLGDEAFVGNEPTKPAFLELKNLRRLSVMNWHHPSTGLTANCFTKVFRHMSLTHFEMRAAYGTVKFKEHRNWMKLLLEGRFAESIEEIRWNDSRLHQVQDKKFRAIGKSFRSYSMF